MRTRLLGACAAVSILALSPAAAQTGAEPETAAGDLTCRQIQAMDSQSMAGVLYFVQGFSEAQKAGDASASAAAPPSGEASASAGAQPSGKAAAPATQGADTASAADAAAPANGAQPAPGASTATADAGAAGTDTGSGDTVEVTGATGADAAVVGTGTPRISGFAKIPVDQVIIACSQAPDSRVADVLANPEVLNREP